MKTAVGRALGALVVVAMTIGGTAMVAGASPNATFTFQNTTAPRNGTVNGSVTGNSLGNVTVTGCGSFNTPVRTGNGPFSVFIPGSQPVGQCTMTFTAQFTDGKPSEQTNQTINVVNAGSSTATLTLTNTSTTQGGAINGSISGPNTIGAVTVSGCGKPAGSAVRTGPGAFSVGIPAAQPVGSCTLTFTIPFTDGSPSQTEARTVSITGPPPPPPPMRTVRLITDGPDLRTATIVAGAQDGAVDTVRYVFDQAVTLVTPAPTGAGFRIQGFDSSASLLASSFALDTDTAATTDVIARFPDGTFPAGYTRGTVDAGMVRSASGQQNPLGAQNLGGSNFSTTTGRTAGPDLLTTTRTATRSALFCFDSKISQSVGVVPSRLGFYTGGGFINRADSVLAYTGPNCVEVGFPLVNENLQTIDTAQARRWFAERGAATGAVPQIEAGPTKVIGLTTAAADLVSAAFVAGSSNQIDFTYDVSVNAPTDPNLFGAVTEDALTVLGTTAAMQSAAVVRVTFAGLSPDIDDLVVLGTASAGAVTAVASGAPATIGAAVVPRLKPAASIGRTDGPDLLGIGYDTVASKASFVFDAAVAAANPAGFFIVGSSGVAIAGTAVLAQNVGVVTVAFPNGSLHGAAGGGVTNASSSQLFASGRGSVVAAVDATGRQNPNAASTFGGGPARRTVKGDFDGNGVSDFGVFRPSTAEWIRFGGATVVFGQPNDVPVPADYTGDNIVDRAVWRPSTNSWLVRGGSTFTLAGVAGDIPVPADYDGDGDAEPALFRPSNATWIIVGRPNATLGASGDIPVPGDYDGDGDAELATFRPSNGVWTVSGVGQGTWGQAGDRPVPADYDGDRKLNLAVYRNSTGEWFVQNVFAVSWGQPNGNDVPVPGDFDGDTADDVAVWRPSTGQWFVLDLPGTPKVVGVAGDIPTVR